MSWSQEDGIVTFVCDSCPEGGESNTSVKVESYAEAWARCSTPHHGWVSFKRVGRSWTHHCKKCAEQAASEHEAYKRREAERERLIARNA